jgi:hypothetical protein
MIAEAATGGHAVVRDVGLLEAALARPTGGLGRSSLGCSRLSACALMSTESRVSCSRERLARPARAPLRALLERVIELTATIDLPGELGLPLNLVSAAQWLLHTASQLLPVGSRQRYGEEFSSELRALADARASSRAQLAYALRQVAAIWALRRALPATTPQACGARSRSRTPPHRPRGHRPATTRAPPARVPRQVARPPGGSDGHARAGPDPAPAANRRPPPVPGSRLPSHWPPRPDHSQPGRRPPVAPA